MVKKSKSQSLALEFMNQIDNGFYQFGRLFPSERTLSSNYSTSRTTIREAISTLIAKKYLIQSQGKGTYVIKNNHSDLKINFKGMSELLKKNGIEPYTVIIASEKQKAGFKLSKIFDINEDDDLYRIIRLRGGDKKPISIEDTYIPYELINNIEEIDFNIFSLYDILAYNNIKINNIIHRISTSTVRNNEAKLLNISDGEPVISIELSSYTHEHKVVEHTKVLVISEYCGFYCNSYFKNGEASVYAQDN